MFGPRLVGSVCTLRPPDAGEVDVYRSWFEEMEVNRTLGRIHVPGPNQEREWFEHAEKSATDVYWAIEHEGRPVGVSAIHAIDSISRHGVTGTVIGDRSVWARGIGRESMALRTDYAFRQLNLHKLCSSYLDGNEASARAQAAAGYREVGRRREHFWRDGRWVDEVVTEVMRRDWESR